MHLSLTAVQRTALLTLAGAAYGLAFLTDASALTAQTSHDSLRVAASPEPAEVAVAASIKRDPFAPTPAPHAILDGNTALRNGGAGGFAPIPAGLTVPSIDGLAQAPGPPHTLTLKATIAGPQPVAYVEDAGHMTIARPGDAVSGLRVRSIDLRGVVFDDGTRLDLPDRTGAPPAAVASAVPATRKTLDPAQAAPSATPAQSAADPTPGPLPTPKAGAYPLGAAPTSDPAAPTAFPYPYPYAPH